MCRLYFIIYSLLDSMVQNVVLTTINFDVKHHFEPLPLNDYVMCIRPLIWTSVKLLVLYVIIVVVL